ncbi:hypothetical protein NUU27_23690, partial [Nitratireductor sp. ZSWI3]|nr:hypothetical protein [Nitratireductor sp. ZSWI3]
MADHSSTQRADIAGLTDDDPFAELTRIIGHDPLRANARKSEEDLAGDDLALELENELLGDLSAFSDEEPQAEAADDSWRPAQDDWRFNAPEQEPAAEAPADVVQDLSDELDASFAASFEDELASSAEEAESPAWQPEEASAQDVDWLNEEIARGFEASEYDFMRVAETASAEDAEAPSSRHQDEAPEDVDFAFQQADWAELDADFTEPAAEDEAADPVAEEFVQSFEEEATDDAAAADGEAGADLRAAQDDAVEDVFFDDVPMADDLDEVAPHAENALPSQYMSPQAFADSVAKRAKETIAEDRNGAAAPFDLAAEFEAEFGPQSFMPADAAEEEPAAHAAADDVDEAVDWTLTDEEAPQAEEPVAEEAEHHFWHRPDEATHAGPPLIDTVDVPGERIPVEETRHIPEFVSEPEPTSETPADDLELALARAFGDPEAPVEPQKPAAHDTSLMHDEYASVALRHEETAEEDFEFDEAFGDELHPDDESDADAGLATDAAYYSAEEPRWQGQQDDDLAVAAAAAPLGAAMRARPAQARSRRGLMAAAAIGGVAVLGAIAAFAFSSGGSDAETPALVRADPDPVKVKPENPGGQQVPNQDNQVYQRVSGAELNSAPAQERLVTTVEEPVEVPAPQAEASVPKSEERLTSAAEPQAEGQDEPVTAMAPRRVRTMVVRPDGTLVPREDPAPAQPAASTAAPAADPVAPAPAAQAEAQAPATQSPPASEVQALTQAAAGNAP